MERAGGGIDRSRDAWMERKWLAKWEIWLLAVTVGTNGGIKYLLN
jgi:hypothetical protein